MNTQSKKTFVMITLLTALASMNSCTWDTAMYDEFVNTDGTITKCPTPNDAAQSGELLFIQKVLNEVNPQTGESIQTPILCAPVCQNIQDFNGAECRSLYSDECKDVRKSFEYGLCPVGLECLPYNPVNSEGKTDVDETNSGNVYCGKTINKCITDQDCADSVDGWKAGKCEQNKCSAIECTDAYHPHNDTCEADSDDNCGKHEVKCEPAPDQHITKKHCSAKQCVVDACELSYHIDETDATQCKKDDTTNCGGINCASAYLGWASGTCNDNAKCEATACQKGFHTYNTVVGDNLVPCEIDSSLKCGESKEPCNNTASDIMDCVDGSCQMIACQDGYIKTTVVYIPNTANPSELVPKMDDKNEFIHDDAHPHCVKFNKYECGVKDFNCLKLAGAPQNAENMDCTGTLKCKAKQCAPGYHTSVEGLSPCEPDTNSNCGEGNNNCTSNLAAPICAISETGSKCSDTCGDDSKIKYCSNTKECILDPMTNAMHCGNPASDDFQKTCGLDCSKQFPNSNVICSSGQCKPNGCKNNYHQVGNLCERDTLSECGNSRTNCINTAPETMIANDCENGQCKYQCKAGLADCNGDLSDGCEVDLNQYGLVSCTQCAQTYTSCGVIDGTNLPLCLKQGTGYVNYTTSSTDGCKTVCLNDNNNHCIETAYYDCSSYEKHNPSEGNNSGINKHRFIKSNDNNTWNNDYNWSETHCSTGCNNDHHAIPQNGRNHYPQRCQSKQTCDQFVTVEAKANSHGYNKYFDYDCH